MQIKLSLNRFSCLLFLLFPSAVNATLFSTLGRSLLVVSMLLTNPYASEMCPEVPKICFQGNPKLKFINDRNVGFVPEVAPFTLIDAGNHAIMESTYLDYTEWKKIDHVGITYRIDEKTGSRFSDYGSQSITYTSLMRMGYASLMRMGEDWAKLKGLLFTLGRKEVLEPEIMKERSKTKKDDNKSANLIGKRLAHEIDYFQELINLDLPYNFGFEANFTNPMVAKNIENDIDSYFENLNNKVPELFYMFNIGYNLHKMKHVLNNPSYRRLLKGKVSKITSWFNTHRNIFSENVNIFNQKYPAEKIMNETLSILDREGYLPVVEELETIRIAIFKKIEKL